MGRVDLEILVLAADQLVWALILNQAEGLDLECWVVGSC